MTKINIRDYIRFDEEEESDKEQEEKDEMLEAFTLYDKDRDGLISTREIGTVIRSLGQTLTVSEETDILARFDQDKIHEVDFVTFYSLAKGRQKDEDEDEQLRESFRRFDKEDKGFVDREEMKKMLTTIGEPLTEEEVEDWLKDGKEYIKNGKLFYENFATFMLSK